jgi:predicted secreted hydrolase
MRQDPPPSRSSAPSGRARTSAPSGLVRNRSGRVPGAWFIGSVFAILTLLFSLAWWNTRGPGGERTTEARLSLGEILGGADTAGYARAFAPRTFEFPRDHGAHPEFRNEWWYLTGNLETAGGDRFGYQLTIFRNALAPSMPERDSDWATRQAYMAHFALTDAKGRRFAAFDRFSREAVGLAGADTAPFRVWLEDWSIASDTNAPKEGVTSAPSGNSRRSVSGVGGDPRHASPDGIFPLRVTARRDDIAIDLVLQSGKPLVLNGDHGLSRKGPESGNASYYLSFTRLPTQGSVTTADGRSRDVTGNSWLDREWSTSALPAGLDGWDWFALQFADSTELMFYRLRRADGSSDVFSAGTWVAADGTTTPLASTDLAIEVLDHWASPIDGAAYPSRWHVHSNALHLDLEVVPVLPDQELDLAVRYWEGAVDARGTRDGRSILARGYVELTGYAGVVRPDDRAPPQR